jgi:SAM-dependent methyltransferase
MTAQHYPSYSPKSVASASDGRLFAPSYERNYQPIRAALGPLLAGRRGTVLEIGSGTGQHIASLAADFPDLGWVPSDIFPEHMASIAAWRATAGVPNLAAPIPVDGAAAWAGEPRVMALGPLVAVLATNVIHIAPWAVAGDIVVGAARVLGPGGILIFYGPFRRGGRHTAPSNAAFDAALRADNPAWGVRDLEDVGRLAGEAGFGAPKVTEMPANNLLVAFPRESR